jgi:acyl-CoA synthetase (AMP-forming)/AMP-acid ligase II
LQDERCIALHGVPAMFIAQLDHIEVRSLDLSALRTGSMACSPFPVEVMNRVVTDMHMSEVTMAYGMKIVHPREVEEFLFRHPAVAQVQVFGVPVRKHGEKACAWVVLKPGAAATESQLRSFCQDQSAHYKVTRRFRCVSEISMTVTGKAQKFVMRKAMVEELGLG